MRPEGWTDEQRVHVEALRALLPARPWWMFVRAPGAECMGDGLIMGCDHRSWHSKMPPCSPECQCTVWAMTPAEMRALTARRRTAI